jgi:hypothetical protein
MTDTNNTYDWQDMVSIMAQGAQAIRTIEGVLRRAWHLSDDEDEMAEINAKRDARYWIIREMDSYPVHSVIHAAIKLARPYDWHQLLLEHPHVSQGDRSRIAYTQNEIKGQKNIQTVTSVGKYLNRHFPLPDHTIRDLVARHGSAARYQFVHTTAEMIYHLHKGPGSCMVWREDRGIRCSDGVSRHPYEAYDPKYGWHMAVRIEGDETVGRALCMTSPTDDKKYYVRTYARPSNNGGYSETDNGMENWLAEQGYHKRDCWRDDERLAYHETSDHFLAPFLDGGEKRVTIDVGNRCIVIDNDGEYVCDQTGGCPTDDAGDFFDCENCGDRTSEDDGYWVGRQEDARVCESCINNDYTYAYGRRGNQYYVHNDNVVYVDSQSEYYDPDYLDDNEIVELNNGEYAPLDEAVEVDGDWYHIEDERICRTEDTDEFLLVNDGCWQCEESGNWYTDSIDFVEVDGKKYHPDHAPATDERIDEDEGVPTMLTMEMLDKVLMIWDYTLARDSVRISLTYTLDGKALYAERVFTLEFINGVHNEAFTKLVRNELCSELMAKANDIANAYLESTETQGE